MPSYVYLQHYTSQGDLGISKDVFVTLGEHVVQFVRKNIEKNVATISDEVEVAIKGNEVSYKFSVAVKNKTNIKRIKSLIENYVNSTLMMICDIVPFKISFVVEDMDKKENGK